MKSRKGFTLIELMVVVLIVAVLAAVLIPLMTARLESARWSEGKAGVGTIATAIRARYAEEDASFTASTNVLNFVNSTDLYGKYFSSGEYTIQSMSVNSAPPGGGDYYPVNYTIRVSAPSGASPDGTTYTWNVNWWQMDQAGTWTRNP